MLHFETLSHIHKELPPATTVEDIVQVVKSRMTHVHEASIGFSQIPNRSAVKLTCIIQDNGYPHEIYPQTHYVQHTESGEVDNFNFLFMGSPDDMWELKGQQTVEKYLEKQPHCCIIIPPNNSDILLDRLSLSGNPTNTLPDHYSHPHIEMLFEKKLPGVPKELVCMIKTFSHQPSFSLNEVVHIYGILEKPALSEFDFSNQIRLDELLPTVHCVHYEVLSPFKLSRQVKEPPESILSMATALRSEALSCISSAILGDQVAAEYVYMSLFSKINKRVAGVPTVSFGMNLINQSFSSMDCERLVHVVKEMKPITAVLPLTIESLNKQLWIQPSQARYDLEDHGLCRGEFQAPDGSFFLLNECEMSEGTLVERGVRNVQAIQSAIDFSLVDYGLQFGSIERACDFTFVTLSKCTSLLKHPFVIQVHTDTDNCNSQKKLSEKVGLLIQHLVDMIHSVPFKVSDEMAEIIHNDFVESQKLIRKNGLPADDGSMLLKRLLVAENFAKSTGKVELDVESWKYSGELEKIRQERDHLAKMV